jgi:hypothetical protein
MNTQENSEYSTQVELDMQRWLIRAVIGLNLCPFAKAVHSKRLVRYTVSLENEPEMVLLELEKELMTLATNSPDLIETSLLILPRAFQEFLEFNEFLKRVNKLVARMKLEGFIQVASFHPDFQFAGTEADDITNYSNRAPYPALHLLRETSINKAVESFPEARDIYGQNMVTLNKLGHVGWSRLKVGPSEGDCQKGNS